MIWFLRHSHNVPIILHLPTNGAQKMVIRCLRNAANIYLQPRSPLRVPDNKYMYAYMCLYILYVYLLDHSARIRFPFSPECSTGISHVSQPLPYPWFSFLVNGIMQIRYPRGGLCDSPLHLNALSPYPVIHQIHLFFSSKAFKSTTWVQTFILMYLPWPF